MLFWVVTFNLWLYYNKLLTYLLTPQPIARFQWNFAWSFSQNFGNVTDIEYRMYFFVFLMQFWLCRAAFVSCLWRDTAFVSSPIHLLSDKNRWNDLENWSRSLVMAEFNRRRITFYQWSVVTNYLVSFQTYSTSNNGACPKNLGCVSWSFRVIENSTVC